MLNAVTCFINEMSCEADKIVLKIFVVKITAEYFITLFLNYLILISYDISLFSIVQKLLCSQHNLKSLLKLTNTFNEESFDLQIRLV